MKLAVTIVQQYYYYYSVIAIFNYSLNLVYLFEMLMHNKSIIEYFSAYIICFVYSSCCLMLETFYIGRNRTSGESFVYMTFLFIVIVRIMCVFFCEIVLN